DASDDQCDRTAFVASVSTADPAISVVADSAADWSLNGIQGEKNWFYGYYNESPDTNTPSYHISDFIPFPRGSSSFGANNFWAGQSWKWWNGDPPFDEIGQRIMNPNGLNHDQRHWVIRRWLSEVDGTLFVDWSVAKPQGDGA